MAEPKPWQFKPGTSGNPGGKPKGLSALQDELLSEFGPRVRTVMERLYGIIMDEGNARLAPAAAKLFIERLMGAPAPQKAAEDGERPDQLTDRELWDRVLAAPAVRAVVLEVLKGGKP
jgi:hypothetical protein